MKAHEVKTIEALRVEGLNDLARFAASMAALGQPVYVIHFKHQDKHVYGIFAVFHDFYELYGVPLFYFHETDEPLPGNYILIKAEEPKETILVSEGTRPGYMVIPIVSIREKPRFVSLS
ncbi:MAG: hypothetical protein QXK12_05820 [Candidatus Nezhaarchaeales archaeon]